MLTSGPVSFSLCFRVLFIPNTSLTYVIVNVASACRHFCLQFYRNVIPIQNTDVVENSYKRSKELNKELSKCSPNQRDQYEGSQMETCLVMYKNQRVINFGAICDRHDYGSPSGGSSGLHRSSWLQRVAATGPGSDSRCCLDAAKDIIAENNSVPSV